MGTETFADRLQLIMRERGLRARQLADRSGISVWSINDWLRGDSLPSFFPLIDLADSLHVSIDWLAGRSKERRCRK